MEVHVVSEGRLVLSGGHATSTGLWLLPFAKKDINHQEKNTAYTVLDLEIPQTHSAANINYTTTVSVYTLPYKKQ